MKIVCLFWFCLVTRVFSENNERSFSIDHQRNCFLKDGQPFRYVSGTMHYFRVPRPYWADNMKKMRIAGLNAIQTYIEWNHHEPEPGVYNFEGNYDLKAFFDTASEAGLLVILRPGPYIDAERDFGGLPYWLLRVNKTMQLRTSDPSYLYYVHNWYSRLLPLIKPYLYENGGPIITVQVENEYGSFGCDFVYTAYLRDVLRHYLGDKVVLFTTDGWDDDMLKCGKVYGVHATVDFGSGQDVKEAFYRQRLHQGSGPLVNSEYYPGWIDHWGCPHANISTDAVVNTLDHMLALNACVNIYPIHGGTSFGFANGANLGQTFQPNPTSYDFNAPLTEAGDPTEKYFAIRQVVGKYLPLPPDPLPTPSPKMAVGPINLHKVSSLFQLEETAKFSVFSKRPMSFEDLGQAYGFVSYITTIKVVPPDPVVLNVPGLRDRGYVFVNKSLKGILSREQSIYSMPIVLQNGDILAILVENQGRVCYGPGLKDSKGIIDKVTLATAELTDWTMFPHPLDNDAYIRSLEMMVGREMNNVRSWDHTEKVPAFYGAKFTLPNQTGLPMDTFLRLDGWHKGVAFLNGFNLGRYWPIVGPQVTLYVPGYLFHPYPQPNVLLVFELEHAPCRAMQNSSPRDCQVSFVKEHVVDGPTPFTCTHNALSSNDTVE